MQSANKEIYAETNSPTKSCWMGVISMWKGEQNSAVQQLKSNLMGLGWVNYLISVSRRKARWQSLGLVSDRETKCSSKRGDVEEKHAREGSEETRTGETRFGRSENSEQRQGPDSHRQSPKPESARAATTSSHCPHLRLLGSAQGVHGVPSAGGWPLHASRALVRKKAREARGRNGPLPVSLQLPRASGKRRCSGSRRPCRL